VIARNRRASGGTRLKDQHQNQDHHNEPDKKNDADGTSKKLKHCNLQFMKWLRCCFFDYSLVARTLQKTYQPAADTLSPGQRVSESSSRNRRGTLLASLVLASLA
jgi:hypothetical protein